MFVTEIRQRVGRSTRFVRALLWSPGLFVFLFPSFTSRSRYEIRIFLLPLPSLLQPCYRENVLLLSQRREGKTKGSEERRRKDNRAKEGWRRDWMIDSHSPSLVHTHILLCSLPTFNFTCTHHARAIPHSIISTHLKLSPRWIFLAIFPSLSPAHLFLSLACAGEI